MPPVHKDVIIAPWHSAIAQGWTLTYAPGETQTPNGAQLLKPDAVKEDDTCPQSWQCIKGRKGDYGGASQATIWDSRTRCCLNDY